MDAIYIENIELWTHIGAGSEERATEQRLLISVELFLDTKEAGENDDLNKTIDYEAVKNDVLELGKTERHIIEHFAEDVAQMIIKKYKPEGGVKISIQKFILPETKAVHVTIVRT